MGRALDSQSLRDRDAVLKQFFSAKIANVRPKYSFLALFEKPSIAVFVTIFLQIQNQADTANSNLGVVIAELSGFQYIFFAILALHALLRCTLIPIFPCDDVTNRHAGSIAAGEFQW
jgi:hypothetical protein